MSAPAAYLAVALIWSTTPLAVKWSAEGAGFLLGAVARMGLAAVFCLALARGLRIRLPFDRAARRTYAAASIAVYGAMLCVYWASQYVPSGLIAVLFGLTPFVTALFARWLLDERGLTPTKAGGQMLGLLGLVLIFHEGSLLGPRAAEGIAVLLFGIAINALSLVLVKRAGGGLAPLSVTTGALVYAAPLFLATWLVFDGRAPAEVSVPALWSILYLGLVASALGFTLFYYLLKRAPAGAVALLTLVSPVLALLLGHVVDGEPVTAAVWSGTALVLGGLAVHQWGAHLPALVRAAVDRAGARRREAPGAEASGRHRE
ncbi:DMT(drug/metabolite transporter) superfamily permease [Sulfurifustis variabilis]|uniref:DMT(Drug/metabolite transporter) superfamily permease n=1 Tax=Sulfurifustis variabilis TaxID=1675686 RepID=A0A1B4VAD6_9GAMM|nr:DMT family transporter [Sulfurifustis variabilis]BAU46871.1 DMT(drug/metabolite transporter) superfamily permease [Sulfurifustis variabilis]